MKHNISITLEQKIFREIENARGREKRSTFIEHLIIQGLKNYKTNPEHSQTPAFLALAASAYIEKRKGE
jgi:metal-responsive CopG/Arc/MetJ family transcriptional regulator